MKRGTAMRYHQHDTRPGVRCGIRLSSRSMALAFLAPRLAPGQPRSDLLLVFVSSLRSDLLLARGATRCASNPALDRLERIHRVRVETDLRTRRVRVDDVQELL